MRVMRSDLKDRQSLELQKSQDGFSGYKSYLYYHGPSVAKGR